MTDNTRSILDDFLYKDEQLALLKDLGYKPIPAISEEAARLQGLRSMVRGGASKSGVNAKLLRMGFKPFE